MAAAFASPPASNCNDEPAIVFCAVFFAVAAVQALAAELRLGMVGLDTCHVVDFTKVLHNPKAPPALAGVRIVGAVPAASRDIESSWTKAPGYTERGKCRANFPIWLARAGSSTRLSRYFGILR